MGKKITSVLWSASNVPSGLSFNTATGTFSGTPTTAGDYTVPVTVKTNYGEDTKDVKIKVQEEIYTNMSVIISNVGNGDDKSFRDHNLGNGYSFISNNYNSSETHIMAYANVSSALQQYYQWYADYSLLPNQLCVKQEAGQLILDVKTEGVTFPANKTYPIRILLVNNSQKRYETKTIIYTNTLSTPKKRYVDIVYGGSSYILVPDISEAPAGVLKAIAEE